MLGFRVQEDRPDAPFSSAGLCRLLKDRLELAFGEILSSQTADERAERAGPLGLVVKTGRDFLEENTALPRREILIQHRDGPSSKQRAPDGVRRPGPDDPQSQQPRAPALGPGRIDRRLSSNTTST